MRNELDYVDDDMNPFVKDYLLKKMNRPVEDADYMAAQNAMKEQQSGNKLAQLAAGIGDALARKDSASTDRFFAGRDAAIADQTVGEYQRQKLQGLENKKLQRDEELYDPNSQASIRFRRLAEATLPKIAQSYGKDWSNVTAADKESIFDFGKMQMNAEARRDMANANADLKSQMLDNRAQALETPYGSANTVADAKDLKDAYVSRNNFDAKLQEMIDLRKKYGSEVMNREAVARGKQLSKDLLLEYKNMAKLGVLSQADQAIIDAIIPSNPLAFSPSSLMGQDPILHKLEKFKDDNARSMDARIKTRTKEGISNLNKRPSQAPIGPSPADKAPKLITVSNGKETYQIPPEDLEEALNDGFKAVD